MGTTLCVPGCDVTLARARSPFKSAALVSASTLPPQHPRHPHPHYSHQQHQQPWPPPQLMSPLRKPSSPSSQTASRGDLLGRSSRGSRTEDSNWLPASLHSGRILSCPPTSQTVNWMFLYSTVSTLKPIVGIVVTISPSLSLYRMVVFPAASSPTIRIRISFLPHRRSNSLENVRPILAVECRCYRRGVV